MGKIKNKANIRDVAKAAGVSVASVSYALSDEPSPYISDAKRAYIRKISAKMHYQPNEHCRRLFNRRSNTVALIFSELEKDVSGNGGFEGYFDLNLGACLRGAQGWLSKNKIDLLFLEATESFLAEKRYLAMIRGQLLDGVLLWGMVEGQELTREILHEDIPVVMVQTEDSTINCPSVISNDYEGMCRLLERAIAFGHRHFAVLSTKGNCSVFTNRQRAVDDTLQKHGLTPDYQGPDRECAFWTGRDFAREILADAPEVTCIVTTNNPSAYGCLNELEKQSVAVPDYMSLLSADALVLPGIAKSLSAYFCQGKQVGEEGAKLLSKLINDDEGGNSKTRILVPTLPIGGETLAEPRKL